jgi:hypothetical protein
MLFALSYKVNAPFEAAGDFAMIVFNTSITASLLFSTMFYTLFIMA